MSPSNLTHNTVSHGKGSHSLGSRRLKSCGSARAGFTLIELMIVIVIISILIAMLLPAIGAVRRNVTISQVQVEIKALETGITSFRTEFGSDPPSSITLSEDGTWGDIRSKTIIRRLWPQFDFTAAHDINGDGDTSDAAITLNGAEAMMFFMGGVCRTDFRDQADGSSGVGNPTEWSPLGFSKNPRNPFERSQGTRIGPFHEFDSDRIVDVTSATAVSATPGDSPGMPEYLDVITGQSKPYLFATSYEGKGYRPAFAFLDTTGVITMTAVYLQKLGSAGPPIVPPIAWTQSGFQIISPGFDGEYGIGGLYDKDTVFPSTRSDERDNITGFAGQLE